MSDDDDSVTIENADKLCLTERQNDLMAFALIYLWTTLLRNKVRTCGGPQKFTVDEIETIIHEIGLDDDMIMEAKLDIIRGKVYDG